MLKREAVNGCKSVGKADGPEGPTVPEHTRTNEYEPGWKSDRCERDATMKGVGPEMDDPIGNVEGCDACAAAKSRFADVDEVARQA